MAGEWLDKIKDFAKGNPDKADSAIDKVEDLIDQRTGGRYADQSGTKRFVRAAASVSAGPLTLRPLCCSRRVE